MKTGSRSTGAAIGLAGGYCGPNCFGLIGWPNRGPLRLAPLWMNHRGMKILPSPPPDVDRFGGYIAGNFRGNPTGKRQRDKVRRELRGCALRGFVGGPPQLSKFGAPRPDPDDISLAFSHSLGDPGQSISQVAKTLAQETSSQEWGLGSVVDVGPSPANKAELPAPRVCSPPMDVDQSGNRVLYRSNSDLTALRPERSSPKNSEAGPVTRRLRADLPHEVAASAFGKSDLGLEEGELRVRYALQCHSSSPDDPEFAPRKCDSGPALKNPVEGRPASVNRLVALLIPPHPHHPRECLRITCLCASGGSGVCGISCQ